MPPPRKGQRRAAGSGAQGWMGSAQDGQPTTSHGGVNSTIGASDQTTFRSVQLMVMSKQTKKLIPLMFDEEKGGLLSVSPTLAHSSLTGLTADDHLQYALLAGRTVPQILRGGLGASDALTLRGGSGNAGYLDVDRLSLFDFAGDPTTAGMMQRNGTKLLYHDGTAARRKVLHTNVDPTNAQVLIHNGTIWVPVSLSGAFTIDNAGVATLATVAATKGGTGLSGFTVGDLLQASTTTALAVLNAVATGNVLISGGVGVISSWGKVGLTTHVSGRLPFANLAQGSALSVLGVTGNATADNASIAGTADQILRVNGAGNFVTFGAIDLSKAAAVGATKLAEANGGTNQSTYATGDQLYATGANTLGKLAIGTTGQVQTVAGGVPTWATAPTGSDNFADNPGMHWCSKQAVTATSIASDKTGADRWRVCTHSAATGVNHTRNDGFAETGITAKYFSTLSKITNNGKILVAQILKHETICALRGKTMHFQVKLKASSSKTLRMAVVELQNAGTADTIPAAFVATEGAASTDPTFGSNLAKITPTAGTNTSISNGAASCSVTTSWQLFSINTVIPSNSKNLCLVIWTDGLFTAATDTLSMTEADFFEGSQDRNFNPTPLPVDYMRCSEFCYVPGIQENGTLITGTNKPFVAAGVTGTGASQFVVNLPAPGFKTPTVSGDITNQWIVLDGTTNPPSTAISIAAFYGNVLRIDAAAVDTASRGALLIADATGGRRLVFDMEF